MLAKIYSIYAITDVILAVIYSEFKRVYIMRLFYYYTVQLNSHSCAKQSVNLRPVFRVNRCIKLVHVTG